MDENEIRSTIKNLEHKWEHKWQHIIDQKTVDIASNFGLPFANMMGEMLDRSRVDKKISERLGDLFAYYTHISFVAGIEFGKFVGPIDGRAMRVAYETVPLGENLTKYLVAAYIVTLGNLMGDEFVKRNHQKIIEMLVSTLYEFFKAGKQVSSYL